MKVVVAMSGGVDSSVAAALLKEEGHEVIGVTMQLWPEDAPPSGSGGCCGLDEVEDARRVARRLGIRHYVMNFREVFDRTVIADFCREYRRGRTPNPCIRCNQHVKFHALLARAEELGAARLATGHHARIAADAATGAPRLRKGADPRKDQSYFLYTLTPAQMARVLMPIGHLTKDRVREIAGGLGLAVADKPESQEICFIPGDDYAAFLKERLPEAAAPGPILDEAGNVLGEHPGIMFYTIGQRRGLGLAAGEPRYVTAIAPERRAVVVGTREQTYRRELTAGDVNWLVAPPRRAVTVKAKVRYRHPEASATVTPLGDNRVYVKFTEPQMAVTPGQAVVFYDGGTVIGGGTISQGDEIWPA